MVPSLIGSSDGAIGRKNTAPELVIQTVTELLTDAAE